MVGHGAGQPVTFYVTPVSNATVQAYNSSEVLSGADGDYPTDATQNLSIGARTSRNASLDGQMVDQAIYDRALTTAEIQQLFAYTKQDD